jgi:hypothetical protein
MINERADFKKDLEDVLNSYVSKIGVQDILSELYPLLKHTEFKYSIMLRGLYIKEITDAPPIRELTDEEILSTIEQEFGEPYDKVIELCATLKNDLKISMLRTLVKAILKASRGEE